MADADFQVSLHSTFSDFELFSDVMEQHLEASQQSDQRHATCNLRLQYRVGRRSDTSRPDRSWVQRRDLLSQTESTPEVVLATGPDLGGKPSVSKLGLSSAGRAAEL